jgi:hypothetical protein
MTYNLFTVGPLDRDRLAEALASLTALPVETVDVGDANDEDRNWDAAVSCTYEPVAGDVTWSLDIYLTKAVSVRPSEPQVATFLAEELTIPVLYPASEAIPSAYWITAPGCPQTRARLYSTDDDVPRYVIDAVERPIELLPALRVASQPEVIREHRMPTPITDQLRSDIVALAGAGEDDDVIRRTLSWLAVWESLTVRMAGGWPPDGWYPAEFYREDLESRTELDSAVRRLPDPIHELFIAALHRVDETFRTLTQIVGEDRVTAALRPNVSEEIAGHWWWQRLPEPEPWHPAWAPREG